MNTKLHIVAALAAAGGVAALLSAPSAAADLPKCTNTTPTTTQCETAGGVSTRIVTGPGFYADGNFLPFPEYPWGTGGIGVPILGKGGI